MRHPTGLFSPSEPLIQPSASKLKTLRERFEREVEAFLKQGGRITELPPGATANPQRGFNRSPQSNH